MMRGLDLSDGIVRGVLVDGEGRIRARAERRPAVGDLPRATREAADELAAHAGGGEAALGLTVATLGADWLPAVRGALGDEALGLVAAGEAHVLAEAWCGAAAGLRTAVAMVLGEHVSAGLQLDGTVWRGAFGEAGSVGWLALNPVEREDYRRLGGFEAEVGAAGIVRRLVWRIKSGDRSSVVDQVGGDLARLTADHVLEAARAGDGVCVSVVRDTARYIGMAVANLVATIDPEIVVLGGRVAAAGDLMLEAIRHEATRRLGAAQAGRLRVELSPLGLDAGAIGAARAASRARP